MQIAITFRNFEASDPLKEHARERVERVLKYLDCAGDAHVVLSLERHLHHAEITLHAGALILRGRHATPDMYTSLERAMDRIEAQLRRDRDRQKQHHGRTWIHHQIHALAAAQG